MAVKATKVKIDPGEVALVCEDCGDSLVLPQTDKMVWYCEDCGGRRQPRTPSFNAPEEDG